MSSSLRFGLILASLIALIAVLVSVVRKKLNIKYSIVWILWALLSLFMAAFPSSFYAISDLLGILVFYLYLMISKSSEEIICLTYEVASLRKELEDLKKKKK